MPKFNTSFELNVRDIELIEAALQLQRNELSLKRLSEMTSTADGAAVPVDLPEIDQTLADIETLLGRLHNQKVFYRPSAKSDTAYVSG